MIINKDQIKGRTTQAQGKVQEVIGKAVGDKELEVKGNIIKNIGAVQAAVGDATQNITKIITP